MADGIFHDFFGGLISGEKTIKGVLTLNPIFYSSCYMYYNSKTRELLYNFFMLLFLFLRTCEKKKTCQTNNYQF